MACLDMLSENTLTNPEGRRRALALVKTHFDRESRNDVTERMKLSTDE